jgi:phospholipid/cholesterol/gamma-HCH transport system substrate-binding protein
MKDTVETRLGIFFALALVVAVLLMESIGSFDFFRPGYHIGARFKTVQDLKAGDPVKMAGYPVGTVERIKLGAHAVEVTMKIKKIDGAIPVRTDSKATIKFLGLMGQNYVSIDFGTTNGVPVTDGFVIDIIEQPDLSTLMTKLDNIAADIEQVTKSFSGDKFSELLGPFADVMKDNRDRFAGILSNAQSIAQRIADGDGTVGKLVNDRALYNEALDAVSNLNNTATDVRRVVLQAQITMNQINAGQGTVGKLIKEDILYQGATNVMANLTNAMANLREIMEKINRGQGSIGKFVNDDSLFKNVKLTLQKVDKATEGLEDQGPLSVLGIAVNNLF